MRVCLEAFAKLNLALRVVRRRSDGFHEIDSHVQTIDLCDRVMVERADAGVEVFNDAAIEGVDIAEHAARAMIEAKDLDHGFRISVEKRIPIGAGLGGGSSDAAAVLTAIDRMTPPELDPAALCAVAAEIGSDVPLFLTGGLLRIAGRGEMIERMDASGIEHYVLVVPPVHCATAAVYGAWRAEHGNPQRKLVRGENDLLPAALSLHPELAAYRDAVSAPDAAYWGMTGSGCSFYAAFENREAALQVAGRMSDRVPDARVMLCRAVDVGQTIVKDES